MRRYGPRLRRIEDPMTPHLRDLPKAIPYGRVYPEPREATMDDDDALTYTQAMKRAESDLEKSFSTDYSADVRATYVHRAAALVAFARELREGPGVASDEVHALRRDGPVETPRGGSVYNAYASPPSWGVWRRTGHGGGGNSRTEQYSWQPDTVQAPTPEAEIPEVPR